MRVPARTMTFFDLEVIKLITEKYGLEEKEAITAFIKSKTYDMLSDSTYEVYAMSPRIVFDMWESEKVTGDPRNSQYIRE
ncbi:hypothetical protein M2145_001899 [Lachnospiraceae bacterium PF1-21]|uniref:Uncharacterized protein n=1 Tax=Ohessyouella blattaphilus TaxID=2949333 RepID=A0ABT1ENR6_9FIRM|nr:hypothetical protein [Ohessyouella blattaphilus]MCP1110927.1 hypothetical protein [Ohessyouella blattaphilus]MCR8564321.1 hypothetical protein [Ohessyouella blattaphilus]MDL2250671.1 hypothetical protein [Lachnospiraceae bacterium OttesenSCG-928-J05]